MSGNKNPLSLGQIAADLYIAEATIKKAETMSSKAGKFYRGQAGYHLQQAAEKIVKYQIYEMMPKDKWYRMDRRLFGFITRKKLDTAIATLHRTGIKDHKRILNSYPNELSDVECQKVMITMAICAEPKLIIADEPISNLSINFLKLFCNTYNVYYFSSHVPEEIHFGRLRLFTEGEHVSAKLVIGLPESDSLHDPDLNRIFEKNSNSFDEYNKYKNKQIRFEDRNSYYYYGTAEISAPMLILTMYGRDKDNRENDHKLQVLINVRKIIDREIEEPGGRPYLTGMSTVISMPNKKHSSLRIFRMGLSGWDIPDKDINSLIPLLRHNHTENQRIIMTEEDDRNWLSATAKYQPKTSEN